MAEEEREFREKSSQDMKMNSMKTGGRRNRKKKNKGEAKKMKKTVERKTRESGIVVSVEDGKIYSKPDTGREFLNHMLETISWRSGIGIEAKFESTQFSLSHVIAEDVGIVLGKALLQMYEERMEEGVNGFGESYAVIDEAMAFAAISIEGRANSFIELNCNGVKKEQVEDMLSEDLESFIGGIAQGMKATIRVNFERGGNAHESWEAGFRALGEALRKCFEKNEMRKGLIAGVKGTLE